MYKNGIETFLEIEKKHHLYDKQLSGIHYWVYSRFMIWEKIQQSVYGLGDAHRKDDENLISRFRTVTSLFYHSFLKPQMLKEDVDIFFFDHPRRIYNDGYYDCCYTTALALEYKNSITGECPYLYGHKKPVREKDLFYLDKIIVLGNLYYYFYKLFRKKKYKAIRQKIGKELEEALQQIDNKWQAGINKDWIIDLIVKRYFICLKKKRQYERLLKKLRPKVIIEVVSYSMDCMLLNELGKKYGIPTIELQHGTMGTDHIAYNYSTSNCIQQFPDYVFLFSDYWKHVTNLPIKEDHIKIVGYSYFDSQVKKYAKQRHEKKSIIFISQGTIGSKLSQFAVKLAQHQALESWNIFYKLHPGEFESWEKDYPWLKTSGITVVGKDKSNIYELFSICDVQIGVYSTALFEGMGFGLQTFIYKIYRSKMFNELCSMGYAEFVSSIEECVQKLMVPPKNKSKCFWKKYAFKNTNNEIDKILNSTAKH